MKSILAALFILSILSLAPYHEADAAATSLWCTVDKAGPAGPTAKSGVAVFLTIKSSNKLWASSKGFIVPAVFQKEFLATALTAMANGKQVLVQVIPSGKSWALSSMYLTTMDAN